MIWASVDHSDGTRTWVRVTTYRIVRIVENSRRRVVLRTGLTLEQARTHCGDPETSSASCTSPERRRYTRRNGRWFEAFEAE